MAEEQFGKILMGSQEVLDRSFDEFSAIQVDLDLLNEEPAPAGEGKGFKK